MGEMTQIRAEDIDFSKGYLHVQALNAKFNKPRTVVLMPQVSNAIIKQLSGRSKGWLFPSYRSGGVAATPVLAMGDDKMENKTTTGIFLQEGSSGSRKRRMESRFQLSS